MNQIISAVDNHKADMLPATRPCSKEKWLLEHSNLYWK